MKAAGRDGSPRASVAASKLSALGWIASLMKWRATPASWRPRLRLHLPLHGGHGPRSHAVDLDDRLASGHREMVQSWRNRDVRAGRQGEHLLLVDRVAKTDEQRARKDCDVLDAAMEMRRELQAVGHF